MSDLSRLSLNQATIKYAGMEQAVSACLRAEIPGIGLWREPVAEYGLRKTGALLRQAGLTPTSMCRGGFFTSPDSDQRIKDLADNRAAVDECAELGVPELVLVSGGLPEGSRDVDGARSLVLDSLAELAPYAGERGVRLAIEPLHPMFCSDRCVVATLAQALDLASHFPAEQVGVVVDTYHIWWDPTVYQAIERAAGRISAFQVCDWITPLPAGVLLGRGMMGDGCIELRRMRKAVDEAGYAGPIEVEIFNQEIWDADALEIAELTAARYIEHVL
ncbi:MULTISPECIES: sugar phosphate isomerase/epimerase family protein [Actinoalloteichus]|uniref:Sugar phosphate isomerase/epimerase n=1 Tax=Actinoalloteichus fjordicus TaxID=1612552 RepID=A0AAC9LI16_9PSEU|nr:MULTISPECIES: sugar phosphate isomerase/epimerase family protein [Actinoalloteichus]APU16735.1 sugar phosphate isomerase/epimerase [Actinoalloteichus fjordicus]APU22801.1 sugar phosphate isomerase/epimerase [Actinoalloteichus sp. GBA129-24]